MESSDGASTDEELLQDRLDQQFGTPPTRTGFVRGPAGRSASRGGSKLKHNATAPGTSGRAARMGKQSAAERKRNKDRWQRDRTQARAFKVLDPMLLDVLGIEEAGKEGAAQGAAATGLSTPASGSLLHGSSSQAELGAHNDLGSHMGPGHRPRSSRTGRPPADAYMPLPSPSSGRSSPAPPTAQAIFTRRSQRASDQHAAAGLVGTASAWAAAAATPPSRPPSAPPVCVPHHHRTGTGMSMAALAVPPQALEPSVLTPTAAAQPSPSAGAGHRRQGSAGRRTSTMSGSISGGLGSFARDKIELDREAWSARISHVLSREDDTLDQEQEASAALEDATESARTLRDQVEVLQTPPQGWVEVESHLRWLEDCRSDAVSIMRKLNVHRAYLSASQLAAVRSIYASDLAVLAEMIARAVESCLEPLADTLKSEDDVRVAMRISSRAIQNCTAVAKELREENPAAGLMDALVLGDANGGGAAAGDDAGAPMEHCAVLIVEAAMGACRALARKVLQASSLTTPAGHATSQQARCMHAMWKGTTDLLARCVKAWERQALELNRQLGDVYADAARLALAMIADTMCDRVGHLHMMPLGAEDDHSFDSVLSLLEQLDRHCLPSGSTSTASSVNGSVVVPSSASSATSAAGWPSMHGGARGSVRGDTSAGKGGAWGSNNTGGRPRMGGMVVTDEELLAHTWVPRLLLDLHARAGSVHRRLRELLTPVLLSSGTMAPSGSVPTTPGIHRRSTQGSSGGLAAGWSGSGTLTSAASVQPIYDLLDELQERFSPLVLANLQRTAWLCSATVAPATWALEVLRDQAENALRLAKAYDAGTLGMEDALAEALGGLQSLNDLAEAEALSGETQEESEERAEMRREYETRLQAVRSVLNLLRNASEHVVNALLHIRRQLRIRRTDHDHLAAGLPARLPVVPQLGGSSSQNGAAPRAAAGQRTAPATQADRARATASQPASQQHTQAHAQQGRAPEHKVPVVLNVTHPPAQGGAPGASSPFAAVTQQQVPSLPADNDTEWPAITTIPATATATAPTSPPPATAMDSTKAGPRTPGRSPFANGLPGGVLDSAGSSCNSDVPALPSAPATRSPSCDPGAGASWYGDQARTGAASTDATATTTSSSRPQPHSHIGGTSWRAVVASTTLGSALPGSSASTSAAVKLNGPIDGFPRSNAKPGSSAPTDSPASSQPGTTNSTPKGPQTPTVFQSAAPTTTLTSQTIEEGPEEEEGGEDGQLWHQARRGRKKATPVPSSAVAHNSAGLSGSGSQGAGFSSRGGRVGSGRGRGRSPRGSGGGGSGGESSSRPTSSSGSMPMASRSQAVPSLGSKGPAPSAAGQAGKPGGSGPTTPRSGGGYSAFANTPLPLGSQGPPTGSSPGRAPAPIAQPRSRPPLPAPAPTHPPRGPTRGMSPFLQATNTTDFMSRASSGQLGTLPATPQADQTPAVNSHHLQPALANGHHSSRPAQPSTQAAPPAAGPGPAQPANPQAPQSDDQFWQIPWSMLSDTIIATLGSGSFGSVYRGRYFNSDVAIKVVNIDRDMLRDERALARFRREVDFQRQLSHHHNIVRFMGACCEYEQGREHGLLAIVMEYCMLGNLFKMVSKARHVGRKMREPRAVPAQVRAENPNAFAFYSSWETRLQVAYGAAAGVQFMHHHNVVHRDLTSNNLVLDRKVCNMRGTTEWVTKVCDFNLSRYLGNSQQLVSSGRLYSPLWASPELLDRGAYGKEADVYSFGIILWEILTLNVPYSTLLTNNNLFAEELDPFQTSRLLTNVTIQVPQGLRPALPQHATDLNGPPLLPASDEAEQLYATLRRLIERCWHEQPGARPRMEEVASVLRGALETVQSYRAHV